MAAEKGRASGPQRRPKHDTPPSHEEEASLFLADRDDNTYGQVRQRMIDEATRLMEAVGRLTPISDLPPGVPVPVDEIKGLEVKLAALRVDIDQLADEVMG